MPTDAKTTRLPIRLTDRTKKALGRAATHNHRSAAAQAIVYVEKALRENGYLVGVDE